MLSAIEELTELRDILLRVIERIATVPPGETGANAIEIKRRMKILKEIEAEIIKLEDAL